VRLWDAEPRFIAWGLKRDIKRKFPQLGRVEVAQLWSGTLGRAVHRMPQVGEMERGLWVASGFGGHGLNTTAMAGDLIARGIVDNDETWRLFAPYELVWAGGMLGRVLAQGLYWGSRPLARIEREVARYREILQQQRKARLAKRANGQARAEAEKAAGQAAALAALAEVAEQELAMVEQGVAPDATPRDEAPPDAAIPAADFVPPAAADVMPPPVETLRGEALTGEAVPPPPVSAGEPMQAHEEPQARPQSTEPKEFGRRKKKPRKKRDQPPE